MSEGTRRPDGTRPDDTDPADSAAAPDTGAEPTADAVADAGVTDNGVTDDGVIDAEVVGADLDVVPPAPPQPASTPDYDEHGVPSFGYVRDKIEGRYATGLGATELAAETAAGRSIEQQEAERAEKAAAKLAEIRRSLGR